MSRLQNSRFAENPSAQPADRRTALPPRLATRDVAGGGTSGRRRGRVDGGPGRRGEGRAGRAAAHTELPAPQLLAARAASGRSGRQAAKGTCRALSRRR